MAKQTISIQLSSSRKEKPEADQLQFGRVFTDHMFTMDYSDDKGWHDPKIIPYQPLVLEPASMVFHYGQSVFEGLKAYSSQGKVLLFRPEKNFQRFNVSNERLCIPDIDEEFVLDALEELISIDSDWVPDAEGTSLYIRPFIISTEPFLGVAPSRHFKFLIILSPVGSYYTEGIKPIKISVESNYVRAVKGGTGTAKTGGNYAASLKAQESANSRGCAQVLWLDGVEKKYIEEVGSMNVFFKIGDTVVTPELNGSILDGVTRNSVIQLLQHWDIPVVERKVSMEELYEAYKDGTLEEAWGTGTAAVISPVGEFVWGEESLSINNGETGPLSKRVYDTLTGIQTGTVEDPFGWVKQIQKEKTYA
ncbi:branched-chain amino acid aminotransferase [Peribacillus sp. SCS-37]|uniref:branched-chain amino acid aminotransferase n=1 Tax=Paraperibacillus esterisolvens TaxID=3115296 RepID=UPI003906350D